MVFALTIFISAVLVFLVQPIIAKYILPWWGGSSAVWSACVLFFQLGLLLGYTYTFLLVRFLSVRKQVIVHGAVLLLSLLFLPITPNDSLKPSGMENPAFGIIRLLTLSVGLPFVLVSTTGPLIQSWFGVRYSGRSPYRLYALSNLGSLLGLVSYPFLLEPNLELTAQTWIWTAGYILFVAVCSACGFTLIQSKASDRSVEGLRTETGVASPTKGLRSFWDRLLWLLLSATGTLVMLSSTNKLTQDVASVPFLWVLPLCLYLVSLIIAFDSPRWYRRWIWVPLFVLSLPVSVLLLNQAHDGDELELLYQVGLYSFAMFVSVMVCHGELARSKPAAEKLTGFYLVVALGGALGGGFVTFGAPMLFLGYWEYPLGILLVLTLGAWCLLRSVEGNWRHWKVMSGGLAWVVVAGMTGVALYQHTVEFQEGLVSSSRNFFGVLRVYDDDLGTDHERRKLYHGRINHGQQWLDPQNRMLPTSYFGRHSGVGLALRRHPIKQAARDGLSDEGIHVGVIGLGIGTLAAYSRTQDSFTFYEIDPQVEEVARTHFSFLGEAKGNVDVVIGDARVTLEREIANDERGRGYDILVVDAFSGDAIPLHLLTLEAFELYFRHLKPDGILAVHISNRHINLRPVVTTLADHFEIEAVYVKSRKKSSELLKSASWVLLSSNREFFENERVSYYVRDWVDEDLRKILWTDQHSSLLPVLKD